MVKNLSTSVGATGDVGLIPELGRFSGEGNGNPLQYSCLENPMDKRALTGSQDQIQLSMHTEHMQHKPTLPTMLTIIKQCPRI